MSEIAQIPVVAAGDRAPRSGQLFVKCGGTSVADPERIRRVARRAVAAREAWAQVVVASAIGKPTDQLISLAHEVSERPAEREMDKLPSTSG